MSVMGETIPSIGQCNSNTNLHHFSNPLREKYKSSRKE